MNQLAAVGLRCGAQGRVVPPRNAPCQTCLIQSFFLALLLVRSGRVWVSYGSVRMYPVKNTNDKSLPLFQTIHPLLTR